MNIVEHLAARELISPSAVGRDKKQSKKEENIRLTFATRQKYDSERMLMLLVTAGCENKVYAPGFPSCYGEISCSPCMYYKIIMYYKKICVV